MDELEEHADRTNSFLPLWKLSLRGKVGIPMFWGRNKENAEGLLMSTQNICFHGEIRKHLPDTHSYRDLCLEVSQPLQHISLNDSVRKPRKTLHSAYPQVTKLE